MYTCEKKINYMKLDKYLLTILLGYNFFLFYIEMVGKLLIIVYY